MKILTPEEQDAHSRATWQGGLLGGIGGLAVGTSGVFGASRRYHAFRTLSLPFRAFIITSSTTFTAVVTADRYSRAFERARHPDAGYQNQSEKTITSAAQTEPFSTRAKNWVTEQRYPIVFGSWVASMVIALGLVGRSPYMSGQQKLVQARVYAQGLTLAVLVASFALEGNDMSQGKGRWETVRVLDPDDPEHKRMIEKQVHHESYQGEDQWMDMIESQERKMKERGERIRARKGESIYVPGHDPHQKGGQDAKEEHAPPTKQKSKKKGQVQEQPSDAKE